jgi:hypothetical protein
MLLKRAYEVAADADSCRYGAELDSPSLSAAATANIRRAEGKVPEGRGERLAADCDTMQLLDAICTGLERSP